MKVLPDAVEHDADCHELMHGQLSTKAAEPISSLFMLLELSNSKIKFGSTPLTIDNGTWARLFSADDAGDVFATLIISAKASPQ
ncbi:hypothetical protein [Plasticicumulans acidivorans]|uniref:hypothetical protein n=1 Tax=Plasticicumulans acidivorans TaxID=886464 RepID=UPI0014734AE3|nr:hypothetical protein [Plasticicumulans acidivorans]